MAAVGVRSYGAGALLVDLDSAAAAVALRARLEAAPPPGVLETMPGLQTVLVRFDAGAVDVAALARSLVETADGIEISAATADGVTVTVRVEYDGPDLDDVAAHTGLSVADVVAVHQAATYRVVLIGMAPGFYFLGGGDDRLRVPRRRSPRERVPRGALGLADAFTGIYPRQGPGGWQLIGRVLDELWHADRYPAAALAPGTTVRCVAA